MNSRRRTLQAMALGAAAFGSGTGLSWSLYAQAEKFPNPLKIPELLEGELEAGLRHFHLQLQPGVSNFFPDLSTASWGINGNYLGPTLRMRDGDAVQMHVRNTLEDTTTLHWHGLRVPAVSDGGPAQLIEPGGLWEPPQFTVRQSASTFWYHSHMLDETGPQVYKGLAGMLIVDDDAIERIELPRDYGVDDIPLVIQDRNFNSDGSFKYISGYDELVSGIQGDTILVNGTLKPHFVATTQRIRLRLLNAANARTFTFAFSDSRSFQLIGSDGGLLETPLEVTSIQMAPAERFEIIVDVSDGAPVKLISMAGVSDYPNYIGAMSRILRTMNMQGFDILEIRPNAALESSAMLPAQLVQIPRLDPAQAVRVRQFKLQMGSGQRSGDDRGPGTGARNGLGGGYGGGHYSINGRQMVMGYINERVPMGDIEIWELENTSPMTHPIHIHNVQFQIIERRGGRPPRAEEAGLKDTVKVYSGEVVKLLLRFDYYSDPDNAYMYHCHMLEHEDRGMMGQFLVV